MSKAESGIEELRRGEELGDRSDGENWAREGPGNMALLTLSQRVVKIHFPPLNSLQTCVRKQFSRRGPESRNQLHIHV